MSLGDVARKSLSNLRRPRVLFHFKTLGHKQESSVRSVFNVAIQEKFAIPRPIALKCHGDQPAFAIEINARPSVINSQALMTVDLLNPPREFERLLAEDGEGVIQRPVIQQDGKEMKIGDVCVPAYR